MRRLVFVALAAVFLVGCENATQPEVETVNDPFCIALGDRQLVAR